MRRTFGFIRQFPIAFPGFDFGFDLRQIFGRFSRRVVHDFVRQAHKGVNGAGRALQFGRKKARGEVITFAVMLQNRAGLRVAIIEVVGNFGWQRKGRTLWVFARTAI